MAYTSGTCTDQFDLLGKIQSFLSDNGWKINQYAADTMTYFESYSEGSSNAKRLHASKNGHYLNFRSSSGASVIEDFIYDRRYGIAFNMSSGYSSSLNWDKQPGGPLRTSTSKSLASYVYADASSSYRMFLWDSPFTLLIYIKKSSTRYEQLFFGEVSPKYGTWDGGEVFLSSYPASHDNSDLGDTSFLSTHFYANYSGLTITNGGYSMKGALNITTPGVVPSSNAWPQQLATDTPDDIFIPFVGLPTSYAITSYEPTYRREWLFLSDMHGPLLQALPSAFSGPLPLFPIQPGIKRAGTTRISLLGELPYMKITAVEPANMEKVFQWGGNNYIVLPLGSPATTTYGNHLNPCVAVLYEGA